MPRLFSAALLTLALAGPLHVSAQRSQVLPGTSPSVFASIGGSVLDSVNRPLSNSLVRLRDARLGRSVGLLRTDRDGRFAFSPVDPGSYVAEIVSESGSAVLAASQVLHIEAGQVISIVVKLPFEAPKLLGASPSTVSAVVAEAALAGILLIQISGTATCDTLQ
jgi:hypothetical protein